MSLNLKKMYIEAKKISGPNLTSLEAIQVPPASKALCRPHIPRRISLQYKALEYFTVLSHSAR